MSDHVIAIDGGGTSCRAAVADRNGRIVGRAMRGSANILTSVEVTAANIIEAASEAMTAAGYGADKLAQTPALMGLAGMNVGALGAQLAAALPFPDVRIEHDGKIALQGALGDGDGVIAIFGTGSAYVVRENGVIRTVGGWGFAVGDQASGAVLGRALLQETLLAHDGIRAHSPLSGAVMARFENAPGNIVEFAHRSKPGDYGQLTPMIFAFDEEGDPLARDILGDAVHDITEALDTVVFDGCESLCLLGGLADQYRSRLAPRHGALVKPVMGDALSGAVQLALRAFPDERSVAR